MTLTSHPAALAASVAPPITSMFNASLAKSATMPSVLASAAPVADRTPATAAATKSDLRIYSSPSWCGPLRGQRCIRQSVGMPDPIAGQDRHEPRSPPFPVLHADILARA